MTALSGGDQTALRAGGHRAKLYCTVIPMESVATARIDQSSFTRPLGQLTVDTWTDMANVRAGMTVWIGTTAGTKDIGVFRCRATPTATTLKIGATSLGDFGMLPLQTLDTFADNAYITIFKDFNIWSVASRIASGVFYKDYDVPYVTQNETAIPAVVNIGANVAYPITTGATITESRTVTIDAFNGESISSVLWDIDGGSFTVGNAATTSWTATFPAGLHVITCDVTLDSGAVCYANRVLYVHNMSSDPPIGLSSATLRADQNGAEMDCEMVSSVAATDIPDGAMVIIWEDASWGGSTVSGATTQFVGYVDQRSTTQQPGNPANGFHAVSAYKLTQSMIAYSQQLVVASNPDNWQQIIAAISTPNFAAFYLFYWQTTLAQLYNFSLPTALDSYAFNAWMVDLGNIPGQMQTILNRVSAFAGQGIDGTMYIGRRYNLIPTAQRASYTARMTLTGQDITESTIDTSLRGSTGRVELSAFMYSAGEVTALISHAPGSYGGQGGTIARYDNLLVANQTEANEISAHAFAAENNPLHRVRLKLHGNYGVFEPARTDLIAADMSDVPDWWETNYSSFSAQVIQVSKRYETGRVEVEITVEGIVDGSGAPGETVPVPVSDYAPTIDPDNGILTFPGFDDWDPDAGWEPFQLLGPPEVSGTATYTLAAVGAGGWGVSEFRVVPSFTEVKAPQASHAMTDALVDEESAYLGVYSGALGVYILEYDSGADTTDAIYEDDALDSGATFPTAQTLDGNWALIRPVRGVSGGVALFGSDADSPTSLTGVDGVATSQIMFGSQYGLPGGFASADNGQYSATGGRTNAPCGTGQTLGDGHDENVVFYDLKTEATITDVTYYQNSTGGVGNTVGRVVTTYKNDLAASSGSPLINYNNADSGGGYVLENWSGTEANVRFVLMANHSNTADALTLYLDDTSVSYTGKVGKFVYSSDNLDSISTVRDFGQGFGTPVGDVDDHNSGDTLAAYGDTLYYSATYGAAFSTASGALLDNGAAYACLRIPYYKFSATTTANSNSAALEFIFAADRKLSDDTTLWLASINTATGTVSTIGDITPIIDGTTYVVRPDPNALEVYGNDPNVIRCIARDADEAYQADINDYSWYMLTSTDGGSTWTLGVQVFSRGLRHVSSTAFWMWGIGGIDYSNDGGVSFDSRDGNFLTAVSSTPTLRVEPL